MQSYLSPHPTPSQSTTISALTNYLVPHRQVIYLENSWRETGTDTSGRSSPVWTPWPTPQRISLRWQRLAVRPQILVHKFRRPATSMSCCGSPAQKLPSSISSRYNCCREVSHSSLLPHAGTTNIVPLERYGVWSGGRKHMGGRGGCRKSEVGRALSSSQNWNKGWKNLCHVRIPVTSSAEEARTSPTSRHEPPHQKHI